MSSPLNTTFNYMYTHETKPHTHLVDIDSNLHDHGDFKVVLLSDEVFCIICQFRRKLCRDHLS